MPIDAFTLRIISDKLSEKLVGAKVNRVSEPNKDEIYLLVYTKEGSKSLCVSTNAENARIGFTTHEKPNPKQAYNFCMLLRKYLLGSEIVGVDTFGFERIIKISFKGKNDFEEDVKSEMYVELMGKYSNIILTQNGVILGCLKQAPLDVQTTRLTLPGSKYSFPASQEKVSVLKKDETVKVLQTFSGEDLGKFLFEKISGIAYSTAEECAYQVKTLTKNELYDGIANFLTNPVVCPNVAGDGKFKDFYAVDYSTVEGEKKYYDDIFVAQDEFYFEKESRKEFIKKKSDLTQKVSGLIKKYQKRLSGELTKIDDCKNIDNLKLFGELITANIYKIKEGDEKLIADNYYDQTVVEIPLDKTLSPSKNAQKYYKKYAKEKRTLEVVIPQKEETERELKYLDSVLFEINSVLDVSDFSDIEQELISLSLLPAPKVKKKAETESACRVFSVLGYTIKSGKNNVQNERLLGRAFYKDLWLHTKNIHSSHVIIETKGEEIPNDVIEIAAEICAYYSQANGGGKVPVDYTYKKFVKKPPKSNTGTVIYTDYKTCFVEPNAHEEYKI